MCSALEFVDHTEGVANTCLIIILGKNYRVFGLSSDIYSGWVFSGEQWRAEGAPMPAAGEKHFGQKNVGVWDLLWGDKNPHIESPI